MRRAFSLIEVIIAVTIFAGSIVVVLTLLPSLIQQSAESATLCVAQRLPDTVKLVLKQQGISAGYDALAAAIPVMGSPLVDGWTLVAAADGMKVSREGVDGDAIAEEARFFLVELWRFPGPPLSYNLSGSVLPVYLRISWPYRVPGSAATSSLADRSQISFCTTIER